MPDGITDKAPRMIPPSVPVLPGDDPSVSMLQNTRPSVGLPIEGLGQLHTIWAEPSTEDLITTVVGTPCTRCAWEQLYYSVTIPWPLSGVTSDAVRYEKGKNIAICPHNLGVSDLDEC